jgi:hypothetical protein
VLRKRRVSAWFHWYVRWYRRTMLRAVLSCDALVTSTPVSSANGTACQIGESR